MALMDELKTELENCEKELRKCDEIIIIQQERQKCYAEKKTMLENLIKSAMSEQEKVTKSKPAEKRESTRKSKTKSNEENNSDETTDDAPDDLSEDPIKMSVKDLAEELNVSQSAVANITNKLGLSLKMVDSKYMLTATQVEMVKCEMKK